MMLTDQDYERLSAYLDGELSEADERAALEARLPQEAELRAELEALRATVSLLSALPARKAPRNFTLDARTARRSPPRVLFLPAATFSALSAAAATILITLGALLSNSPRLAPLSQSVAVAPTQIQSEEQVAQTTETADFARSSQSTASPPPPQPMALTASTGVEGGLADTITTEPTALSMEVMAAPGGSETANSLPPAPLGTMALSFESAPSVIQESESASAFAATPNENAADSSMMQANAPMGATSADSGGAAAEIVQAPKDDSTATPEPTVSPLPTELPTPTQMPPTATTAPTIAPLSESVSAQTDSLLPVFLLVAGFGLLAVSLIVYLRTRGR